jgi:hypothetical protein
MSSTICLVTDRPKPSVNLQHILASSLNSYVKQTTFRLMQVDAKMTLRENMVAERRRNQEREQGKRGDCPARKSKEQADHSGLQHITILHQHDVIFAFDKGARKARCLETSRIHSLVPLFWPKDQPFHLVPCAQFTIRPQDHFEADQVLQSLNISRLTIIDLINTRLSLDSLIELLNTQRETLSMAFLHCSMALNVPNSYTVRTAVR